MIEVWKLPLQSACFNHICTIKWRIAYSEILKTSWTIEQEFIVEWRIAYYEIHYPICFLLIHSVFVYPGLQFKWQLVKKASHVFYLHFALKKRAIIEEIQEKQEQVYLSLFILIYFSIT